MYARNSSPNQQETHGGDEDRCEPGCHRALARAFALHLAGDIWCLPSGLVAPLWAVLTLVAGWWRHRRMASVAFPPRFAVAVPIVTALIWLIATPPAAGSSAGPPSQAEPPGQGEAGGASGGVTAHRSVRRRCLSFRPASPAMGWPVTYERKVRSLTPTRKAWCSTVCTPPTSTTRSPTTSTPSGCRGRSSMPAATTWCWPASRSTSGPRPAR